MFFFGLANLTKLSVGSAGTNLSTTLYIRIRRYGATIWNPYLKGDKDKLERIQNRAIRFVRKDYKSRETGAITRMREDLDLETLVIFKMFCFDVLFRSS
jgi:hypothetical protein